MEEQQALAAAARAHHKERTHMLGRGLTEESANLQFLRLLVRQVPGKSLQECDECLKHLEAKRIAYFGPPSRSASTSPVRASRPGSPLQPARADSPLRASRPDSPLRSSRAGAARRSPELPPLPQSLRTGTAADRAH